MSYIDITPKEPTRELLAALKDYKLVLRVDKHKRFNGQMDYNYEITSNNPLLARLKETNDSPGDLWIHTAYSIMHILMEDHSYNCDVFKILTEDWYYKFFEGHVADYRNPIVVWR